MHALRPPGPVLRPVAVSALVAVLMAVASPTTPAELPNGPPVSPPATAPRPRLPGHDDASPPRTRGTTADAPRTRDDLQAMHRRQLEAFDKADADGDGRLSPAEMNAYRAAMRRDRPAAPRNLPPPDKGGPAQGVPNPRG